MCEQLELVRLARHPRGRKREQLELFESWRRGGGSSPCGDEELAGAEQLELELVSCLGCGGWLAYAHPGLVGSMWRCRGCNGWSELAGRRLTHWPIVFGKPMVRYLEELGRGMSLCA